MKDKQKKLNDIDATVILKLTQLQHFIDDDTLEKICNCIVFDKEELSRLFTRANHLQQETVDQKTKHKKNQIHLHRLEIDCKHMEEEIKRLNEVIDEEMFNKFGKRIPLIDLYEAILRRMAIEIKSDVKGITQFYDKEIHCVKKKYDEQVIILENLIQENTEKLNYLTILEEEHGKLEKILKNTPMSEVSIGKIKRDYKKQLTKLNTILNNQRQQKELFRGEIRNLRLKSRPLLRISSQTQLENSSNKILKLTEGTKLPDINADNNICNHQSQMVLNNKVCCKIFDEVNEVANF